MKIEKIDFRNLLKPKIEGLPKYCSLFPYIMYVVSINSKAFFIGWLNLVIVVTIK